jgi:hypothetical protein
MNYRTMVLSALVGGMILTADAGESLYRCQSGIVSIGDSGFKIRETCGEPNDIATVSGGGADVVEELYSYGGGSSIPYVLRLRGGKLVAIERQPH